MRRAAALVSALLLAGCAAQVFEVDPAPLAQDGSPFADQAALYVLRDRSYTLSIYSMSVLVDGVPQGALRREQYLRVPLAPGPHEIVAAFPAVAHIDTTGVRGDFAAGHTYYFVFSAAGGFEGGGTSITYGYKQLSEDDVKSLLARYEDRSRD